METTQGSVSLEGHLASQRLHSVFPRLLGSGLWSLTFHSEGSPAQPVLAYQVPKQRPRRGCLTERHPRPSADEAGKVTPRGQRKVAVLGDPGVAA